MREALPNARVTEINFCARSKISTRSICYEASGCYRPRVLRTRSQTHVWHFRTCAVCDRRRAHGLSDDITLPVADKPATEKGFDLRNFVRRLVAVRRPHENGRPFEVQRGGISSQADRAPTRVARKWTSAGGDGNLRWREAVGFRSGSAAQRAQDPAAQPMERWRRAQEPLVQRTEEIKRRTERQIARMLAEVRETLDREPGSLRQSTNRSPGVRPIPRRKRVVLLTPFGLCNDPRMEPVRNDRRDQRRIVP